MADDEMYPVVIRDNLTIQLKWYYLEKKIFFSQFFAKFLKSRFNFQHFGKKDDPHSFCISEIMYCENVLR